ncbi:MAG TPA: GTPase Era [Candidatus Krumholzibacteria bacterium]|nr:GTPase Era [Candidatus Krumholzibacteria bacterium]
MSEAFRSGFVSLVGKPNVGKSTLANRLVGRKVSITSRKPQTTRHRILAIRTDADTQLILVDTPGLHDAGGRMVNRVINRMARSSLSGVDVILLMINASGWTGVDDLPFELATSQKVPVILVINKVDRLKQKSDLLPLIEESHRRFEFDEIVPVSALSGHNVEALYEVVRARLPVAPKCFPDDQVTDKSARFVVSELIREQLFRQLGQELPYVTAVKIEQYDESDDGIRVHADIWVEKSSHKAIIIGRKGERLKQIGTEARQQIERFVNKHVFLELWVKVRKGWRDDSAALEGLGYSET